MTGGAPDLPSLRYHRFGGGYRREDVEAALGKLLVSVRTVEQDLHALRERSAELERELEAARAELAAYRSREEQLAALLTRTEELLARVEPGAGRSEQAPAGV